jgi:hypothetical protein
MKARRTTPAPFNPVLLTLETQAEVDALFSVLNHFDLCRAIGLHEDDESFEALQPFRNESKCAQIHERICKLNL